MFPAFIQNIKCCVRRVLSQPCYSSQSLLPRMQVSIIVADSHALQVCLIDWQSLAGSWCLQRVTSKQVNATWTKNTNHNNKKRCTWMTWTKRTRCIGDTVCESPLTKQLQHLLRTNAPIPKVTVPGIQEEFHPSTSRHQVTQMPPRNALLLVFKDGVTTHLCPAKQRSMKQHPLQQTYQEKRKSL